MSTIIQKRLLLFLILAECAVPALSQNPVPDPTTVPRQQYAPTPKALEMTRYGQMSPDLNSGIFSYDIPIYTYSDRWFNIPVSLHYTSSGFQPAKMSDEAGLQWTLMAGGAITREIVGVDDFNYYYGMHNCGSQKTDSSLYYLTTNPTFCYHSNNVPSLNNDSKECSSDRYHFTFPGHSGSFVMDRTGNYFLVYGTEDGKGLYDVSWNGISNSFTIKTGDGYTYSFGHGQTDSSEKAREVNWSHNAIIGGGSGGNGGSHALTSTSTVTWLLDRITAPDGSHVDFHYDSTRSNQDIPQTYQNAPNDDAITTFSRRPYHMSNQGGTCYFKSASITYTSYLTRIVVYPPLSNGDIFEIDFDWDMASDAEVSESYSSLYTPLAVPRRHLDSVTVKRGSTVIREADLTYILNGKRPLLTEVEISGLGSYSMSYWTDPANPLPGILTNSLDFWGYYNGRSVTDAQFHPMGIDSNMNEYIAHPYMDPSWEHARLGLLKTITYPTGGSTTITYEPNKAEKIVLRRRGQMAGLEPADPELGGDLYGPTDLYIPDLFPVSLLDDGFDLDCGGVRVKTLTDFDGQDSTSRSYTYSGGIIQIFPRFLSGMEGTVEMYDPAIRFPGSSFDQRHVAYKTVTEHYPDSSKIITSFSSWEDEPDEYSVYREVIAAPTFQNNPPVQLLYDNILREPDSRAYRRGLPVRRQTKDASGKTILDETWSYADIGSGYSAYAVISGQFAWTARTFLCDRKPSIYTRTEWCDGPGEMITETTAYEYNSRGQVKKTTSSGRGHNKVLSTSYPADISGGNYPAMVAAHLLDRPVEQVTALNGKVVDASLTTYRPMNGLYLPLYSYRAAPGDNTPLSGWVPYDGLSVNSLYYKEATYNNFDSHGNILMSQDKDGVYTTYVWDPRGDKLSAAFAGAVNGTRNYYVRGAIPHTETDQYLNADPAQKTFTAEVAGSFSFAFTPADTTSAIAAKLDGSVIFVNRIGNGAQGLSSPVTVTAGSHTLEISGTDLILFRGDGDSETQSRAHPIETFPVTGELEITYPRSGALQVSGYSQDCFFEDFESSGGSQNYGFQSGKGRTSSFNRSISIISGRTYILDYMSRDGNEWHYMRETVTPTTNIYTVSIPASPTSPIDHVRFYPADCTVSSFTWWPTGELRCAVDGSGIYQTYEYDAYGRLTAVRDVDGNLLKQHTYHYTH